MKLQDFATLDQKYGFDAIAADKELAQDIQKVLISLKFLEPPADGSFGPLSTDALIEFEETFNCPEKNFLGKEAASKLLQTSPNDLPQPKLNLGNDLASSIIKYMQSKGYRIATEANKYNIVYVEGLDPDGKLNNDAPNCFNDLRMILEIIDGKPIIRGKWEGTTEPGTYYTENTMSSSGGGAARIAFGQYKSWQVGTHYGGGSEPHEALVQVQPITVYRDKNKDYIRSGDKTETGIFEIDQHWGFDYPRNDISYASAGCLVGRTRVGHREFMQILKQDKRYLRNNKYTFQTTIIPGDELRKLFQWE
ncbi:MAG: peptidoglycan-binding domain-containing protein [Nostoc sp.]|uniref:peptidoglycan-binding domain-containing protein n=2 Tax=Nostoc sp. TaxID=1180 RepID=UPI002FF5F89F